MARLRRFLGTLLPAKRVYLCPHRLAFDRAGSCPECAAKVASKRLLAKLRKGSDPDHTEGET